MTNTPKEPARRKIQAVTEASVILAALATIPIVILEERGASGSWLLIADWLIWGLFAFNLGVDLLFAPNFRDAQVLNAALLRVVHQHCCHSDHGQQDQGRRHPAQRRAVPLDPAPGALRQGFAIRRHRFAGEVALHVLRQRGGRLVAIFLLKR